MGRSVVLSNGRLLVGLNEYGMVHDFYYPYVGEDNLTTSRILYHKVGVYVNGEFAWLDDPRWKIKVDFEEDALVSSIKATNTALGIEFTFKDFVDNRYDAFCRFITVKNTFDHDSDIRLFMHQAYQISKNGRADTALFVPESNYILDYKGWCSLLIYAEDNQGKSFDQYAVGNYGIEGKEGTFRDAEDGELSNNSVEHGGVDSVIRISNKLSPGESWNVSYWVVASNSQFDSESVHLILRKEGLESRMKKTRDSWHRWLGIAAERISKIDAKYLPMVKKSLLAIKAHTDSHGGIIASCDSSIYNYGRDYYNYVWPRDGALTILPLIRLGYTSEPKKFINFCLDTMHPGGYMMHKYQPDRAIGSTWHPLLHRHHPELAIQEDETASVVYAIAEYFKFNEDTELKKELYDHFVVSAANFMSRFIDASTNLPHASYDLWEEKFASHTYTTVATLAALKAAAEMARGYAETDNAKRWSNSAIKIEAGLQKLFLGDKQFFAKSLLLVDDDQQLDETLDCSSAFGFMIFDETEASQKEYESTVKEIEAKLLNNGPGGGVPRYEHDNYFLERKEYSGNPWIITTLWLAQYYVKSGRRDKALELIDWAISKASPSGTLPEQVDPVTGIALGVSPLVWSHATLVDTLLAVFP